MEQLLETTFSTQNCFSEKERIALLNVKGVGPSVVQRLEEIGISSLDELREHDAHEITTMIAASLGSACWKNSPLAKRAIEGAIQMADDYVLRLESCWPD